MPNITGSIKGSNDRGTWNAGEVGALKFSQASLRYCAQESGGGRDASGGVEINASWSSSTYKDNAHVVPNSVKTKYFIKYQ